MWVLSKYADVSGVAAAAGVDADVRKFAVLRLRVLISTYPHKHAVRCNCQDTGVATHVRRWVDGFFEYIGDLHTTGHMLGLTYS